MMKAILLTAFMAASALAHPGEEHDHDHMRREITARDHAARSAASSLGSCSASASAQSLRRRNVHRRNDAVNSIRRRKGLSGPAKRTLEDLQYWETVNHNMTGTYDFDMFTPLSTVFDADTSCILAPYITDGPYYVVGEYMRSNVKEAVFCDGVDLFLEVQYIDINTCEPIPAVAVDIWNANATGVYSGVESEQGGLNTTFLRGIQLTDHDGVATFETIFPGHYEGRATHTHLLAHMNATVDHGNGTIPVWDAPVTHIGQLFWPESLRQEVEAFEPYASNTVEVTTNDEDMWSIEQADANYDPIPKFVYLGESVSDGLFAWIQIGVNASADYTADDYYGIAAYLDQDGGHSTGYSVGPGDGGETPGNGTAPPDM